MSLLLRNRAILGGDNLVQWVDIQALDTSNISVLSTKPLRIKILDATGVAEISYKVPISIISGNHYFVGRKYEVESGSVTRSYAALRLSASGPAGSNYINNYFTSPVDGYYIFNNNYLATASGTYYICDRFFAALNSIVVVDNVRLGYF